MKCNARARAVCLQLFHLGYEVLPRKARVMSCNLGAPPRNTRCLRGRYARDTGCERHHFPERRARNPHGFVRSITMYKTTSRLLAIAAASLALTVGATAANAQT